MAPVDELCPYVGLQPFTQAERDYFFGRESDIRIIASNLYAAALTVLYGASGTGKSSVLMAGVVPQLERAPRTTVVVFREWQSKLFLPALKERCAAAAAQREAKPVTVDPALPLDELLLRIGTAGHTVVLLFDQFEEYFLYHANSEAGAVFDAELARTVNRDDVHANILLSLREDALSKLDRFRARIPNLLANTLRLDHMGGEAAEQAIRKPLDVYNQRHPDDQVTIEDGLIREVIEQVRRGRVHLGPVAGRGGEAAHDESDAIETPFLQLVMTRLWREERRERPTALRRTTFVDKLGGATQIVRSHLADVMDGLTAPQQQVCARFFDRLVTPSGAKVACRVVDLTDWAGDLGSEVPAVLDVLNQDRILRGVAPAGGEGGAPQVEVFHDVLAAGILEWCGSFVAAQTQRAAAEQARLDHRRALRARLFAIVFGVVATIAVVASVLARDAQRRAKSAEAHAKLAEAQLTNAYNALRKDLPAPERELIVTASDVVQSGFKQAQRIAIEPPPTPPAGTTPDKQQQAQPTAPSVSPRVYLQIQNAQQRREADSARRALWAGKYLVPDIEMVKTGPKTNTEVRFFLKGDAGGAEKVAAVLRSANVPNVVVKYVPGYEPSQIQAQQYEVWFASGG